MKTENKKGMAFRVGSIACVAALALTASIGGSYAKYQQTIGAGGVDGDGNGNNNTPRVAEFFFTGALEKNGTAVTATELQNGISLFSMAYGADGVGKAKPANGVGDATTTVVTGNNDAVVAPGTHGAMAIHMEAGDPATDATKCHAETNAEIKLVINATAGDGTTASTVPLIFAVDSDKDGNYEFYSDALAAGTYTFNDPTGLGVDGENLLGAGGTLTIAGGLKDLADATTVYYKANGDAFYKENTFTTKIKGDADADGIFDQDVKWFWAYEITSGPNGETVADYDAADTALGLQAHQGLHGGTGIDTAAQAAALSASQVKVTFAAQATQID